MRLSIALLIATAGLAMADEIANGFNSDVTDSLDIGEGDEDDFADDVSVQPSVEQRDTLEKRDSYPWIGSHFLPKCASTGDVLPKQMHGNPAGDNKYLAPDRPKLRAESCHPWAPRTPHIGISWGAGSYAVSVLDVFDTSDCRNKPIKTILKKAGEPGACFRRKETPGFSAVMVHKGVTVH